MANNYPFTNSVTDSTSDDLADERKALEELRASLPVEHGGVKDVAPISVTQVNAPDIEEENRLLAEARGNVPEIGSKPAPTLDEALKNYGFGNVPSEIYDLAQQETNPEVIHKFPAWFEKTPDQTDYLYEHRKNQSLGDAAQTAVGSAIMGFPSMVASTAKGGIQFLKDVAPEETDPDKLETDLTSQEKLARGLKSLYNPMQDVLEGGWRNLQRAKDHGTFASDQWKIDHGYLTNEEAKKKFRDRDTFNTHNAQYDAKNPDSVARAIDYTLPLTQKAVRAAIATQSASVDAIMAEHPEWTREQASKFKDDHDELQAQQAIQNAISAQNKTTPTEEEMAFGGIANPLGNEFGWVNMGTHLAKMGAEATGKIIRMGGEEGKFTEGGYVPPKGAEDVGEAGKAQKLAEYISDKIQQTGETIDNYLDQIPEPLRSSVKSHLPKAAMGAVPLASGAYGALENPEDRVGGFLKGLTAGSIVMAPRVASDLLKANAKVAGGTGNIFGTAMADPEAALATKLLSYIPSRTIPIVNKNVAKFATDNLKDMVSQGAHLATVATALGVPGDKDPEEVGADIANGILFTGAHGTLNKVLGKDPVQALRDKKRQDFQNYKFLQGLEPTDQSLVKEVTGWNHVVDRSQQNLAQALQDYNQLDPAKTSAEDAKKAADRVVRAKADLADKANANEATQKAYQRQILSILAEEENKINGPAVPNKTVKFRFMTRDQIADQLMRFNNNMDRTTALHYADNAGARYSASGNVPNAGGQSVAPVIFDPLRDSVVLNIDKLRQTRADTGQTMAHVLRHEVAESALHTRQGQDLFQPLRDSLFGKQIMQPDGSYVTDGKGAYTPEMLNEKYLNNYLRQKKTEAEKIQWSKNNGLWDYKNNDYNKPAIARYMQSEILAEANAAGMNDASTRLDSPLDNLRTWAIVNNENSRLARVIQPLVGRGASNPFKSDLTGVTYTPEHFAQVRNANIQLQRLNGALDATESAPASKVKPKDMMSNRALAEGLGKYDGVFQTTKVLEILDDKGNVVHTQPVDPNLFEGEWTHNPENDEKVKVAGYGQTPDIVDKQIIPQGGKVRIASQIVYDTEGKPVARNPNEYKAQQQMRTAAIRQIFDTVDNNVQGAMNRGFAGGYNYRGNITDNQFNALMALPENILSYGEKEKLATMRDLINDPNGGTAMGLYSARLNARGKYVPFTPKVVEGRPFGMQFSKDGHFLSTEFNVTGARDKVRFIAKYQPDILKLWGNDPNKFMEGLAQYMRNWETNPKVDGRDIDPLSEQAAQIRHRNLDDNFDTAMQKRYIYDAFMNTKPPQGEARPANYNPVTIQLPKVSQKNLTKEEKDDAKRSDPNTLIRTRRIDSYHNILRSNGEKYPFSYGHSIFNATPDAQVPFAEEPLPENAAPVEGEQAPAVDPRIAAATQAITPTATTSFGAAFPTTEQPQNMGSPMAQGQGGTERITDATYTDPRTGVVSRGNSHLEANPNAPQEATDRESPAYGFATDSGRIVDRNEAFNIAQNAGQLMSPSNEEEKFHFDRGVLHSGMFTPAGGEGAAGLRFSPAKKSTFAFTTETSADRDAEIARLAKEGKIDEIRNLNRVAILHALSDVKHIPVTIEDTTGVYQGDREVSSLVTAHTDNEEDLAKVRSRIADAARLFKQKEFLEELQGGGKESLLRQVDDEGYQHLHNVTVKVSGLTDDQIEEARKKSGIVGMTLANGRILMLDRGNEGQAFVDRATKFSQAIHDLGGNVGSFENGVSAIKAYSENPTEFPNTVGYEDESLHVHSPRGEQEKLNTPLVRKLFGLMGRGLEAPRQGRRSYFDKVDLTPEHVEKQARIASIFDKLPDNDLQNPLVQEAYKRLTQEIGRQYDYLTLGDDGTKFSSQEYSPEGEPYKSSYEAIQDIRNNNSLKFLKTDPAAFGPEGVDFSYHPLLEDSGRVDANGVPLNYNDLFRAVHDSIAHGLFGAEFGPVGEESAWQTHLRTIDDPMARWALTSETRGQNSWVNYRPEMLNKEGLPLQRGDEGYIPLNERGFARQKAALMPLDTVLTGDAKVDKPVLDLMDQLGPQKSQGSESTGLRFSPAAKEKPLTESYPTSEEGFYSGIQKAIDEKMPNKATPQQILAIVNNPQNVKPEDLKWSNIEGFLEGKKNVTKQEVLDYLKNEGAVKFEERTIGQPSEAEIESLLSDEMGEGMDRQDAIDYLSRDEGRTKYSQWVIPNGENYREVVLTMPAKRLVYTKDNVAIDPEETAMRSQQDQNLFWIIRTPDNVYQIPKKLHPTEQDAINYVIEKKQPSEFSAYTSSHFQDIPNYVAHMRLDERPDSEGRNGLFIEEIQSDRHQQGREKGYQNDTKHQNFKVVPDSETKGFNVVDETGRAWMSTLDESRANEKADELNKKGGIVEKGIPDAPFRKDWSVQMFKRALRDAVASGKDWIGWTSGDTQADRYNLANHVNSIEWDAKTNEIWVYGKNNETIIDGEKKTPEELPDLIGKDAAQRLIDSPTDKDGSKRLSGDGLKLEHKGMKGFYDQILPKEIGKYVKKWGGKVEEGSVGERADDATWKVEYPNGRRGTVYTEDAAESAREAGAKVTPSEIKQTPIWKIKITPKMMEEIQQHGQPQAAIKENGSEQIA